MLPPFRLVPAADDFATDVLRPIDDTVEIPAVRPLPPVPAPRRQPGLRAEAWLVVAALDALLIAIAVGAPALAALVTP